MLGKRSRAIQKNTSIISLMLDLAEIPTIKIPLFFSFTEPDGSNSPTSPLEIRSSSINGRSPKLEGVGLGIVAAMNKPYQNQDSLSLKPTLMANAINRPTTSPMSQPIPIGPAKISAKFRGTRQTELSESYTCVISHHGPNSIRKREYFDEKRCEIAEKNCGNCGFFFESPKKHAYEALDFLKFCYLCRKKLHGRDIYMYRGDKAFCSVECRCQQILSDELKEKCGSEALKPLDASDSPCSAPKLFYAGVAAA
ncbi:hypothetical protein AMTRI_Chr01g136510 [Amborella trichopoda]|uniref:FLZ-type domain-containing protein n=1 Tax=Amborella trichopoda TaxID=13333 RepID=W1PYG8_AMBTC|nr:uncharacterized protein LOC18440768 [Amborella trichopoda]ERN12550.1 hypothetical protein AMTR_s00025p00205050 [Amborella trichopoda]|eukprot:XP_006850969.1 uncharacterized protein LOC18440768 [Amborella trichopoda]